MPGAADDDYEHRAAEAERVLARRVLEEQRVDRRRAAEARAAVRVAERAVVAARRRVRLRAAGAVGAVAAMGAGGVWTGTHFGGGLPILLSVDGGLGVVALGCGLLWVRSWAVLRGGVGLEALQEDLDLAREGAHEAMAYAAPTPHWRRSLYREEVGEIVAQYRAEGRRYRRVHNSLQSLIMVGSAATTFVAALDSGSPAKWRSYTLAGVSFAITLAAMFTGYYKYRERSYFLQQTADAIEEETYAVALGIGPYKYVGGEESEGQRAAALAEFTNRVEALRNEQRRRQQQLDQPAEQATHSATQ